MTENNLSSFMYSPICSNLYASIGYLYDGGWTIADYKSNGVGGELNKLGNIADMNFWGIEMDLNVTPVEVGEFKWNLNLNYSYHKAKIKKLLSADYSDTLQNPTNDLWQHSEAPQRRANDLWQHSEALQRRANDLWQHSEAPQRRANDLWQHSEALQRCANDLWQHSDVLWRPANDRWRHFQSFRYIERDYAHNFFGCGQEKSLQNHCDPAGLKFVCCL